jgi:hypothetical protein
MKTGVTITIASGRLGQKRESSSLGARLAIRMARAVN